MMLKGTTYRQVISIGAGLNGLAALAMAWLMWESPMYGLPLNASWGCIGLFGVLMHALNVAFIVRPHVVCSMIKNGRKLIIGCNGVAMLLHVPFMLSLHSGDVAALGMTMLSMAGSTLAIARSTWKPLVDREALLCVACGYDRRGNAERVCPECGCESAPQPIDESKT